jgi:hypothetical protein
MKPAFEQALHARVCERLIRIWNLLAQQGEPLRRDDQTTSLIEIRVPGVKRLE